MVFRAQAVMLAGVDIGFGCFGNGLTAAGEGVGL